MILDDMKIKDLEQPVILEKPDGTRLNIMADIHSKTAYFTDLTTSVAIDDILERVRGNVVDRYLVTNVIPWNNALNSRLSLIEPHIQATIIPESQSKKNNSSYNIGNIQANRVYFNSTDNSTNVNIPNNDNGSKFEELKRLVARLSNDNEELLSLVDEMRENTNSSSFSQKYQNFMAYLANHVTVLQGISPFIPWLSSFIQ